MKNLSPRKKAFTLIELLIVITIIGILAVALVPRLIVGTAKARDATRKSDLQTIATAVAQYYNDTSLYPWGATTQGCVSTTAITTALANYTATLPADPLGVGIANACTTGYAYYQTNNGFILVAELETVSSYGQGVYKLNGTGVAVTSSAIGGTTTATSTSSAVMNSATMTTAANMCTTSACTAPTAPTELGFIMAR